MAGEGARLRGAVEGRTRFIGPGAVYAMNPCEDAAFSALEAMSHREVKVVELVTCQKLATTLPGEDEYGTRHEMTTPITSNPERGRDPSHGSKFGE